MHVRVVRFSGVSQESMDKMKARIDDGEGPPPGVPATGIKVLYDEDQQTAVVLQYFENAENMRIGGETLSAMDPSETPGTRASVDACEIQLELEA